MGFKLMAGAVASCALIGVAVGVGIIYGSLLISIGRNPKSYSSSYPLRHGSQRIGPSQSDALYFHHTVAVDLVVAVILVVDFE